MRRLAGFLILTSIFTAACGFGGSQLDSTAQINSPERPTSDDNDQPPFQSKEPEKYQAQIAFAYKWDATGGESIEQITFVARDGLNRRFDFETGDKRRISRLETEDGKRFLIAPQRKIYAQMSEPASENLIEISGTEEYSLAHLLYIKPPLARFQKIGAEEINGRQLTKYLVDFGAEHGNDNARTETAVWIDENINLPVRTEITAIVDQKPGGAKSVVELRDFKSEPDAGIFSIPANFRQVSVKEFQEIIKSK